MKSYVLDTAVLVAAFRSATGASRQLLDAARGRRFELLLSVPLVAEYEAVLTRPEQLAIFDASKDEIEAILDELILVCKKVSLTRQLRPLLSDANDEMVLETAVNGEADAIVTFNDRDFKSATERFRMAVIRPGRALREIELDERV